MLPNSIKLIKPPRLAPGSNIGVVCPADSADVIASQLWQAALTKLRSKKFEVVEGRFTRTRLGHTSGTIAERAEDLMNMFADRSISAIMAALGGSNSHQLLPFLDYDVIRQNPKIFIGFSDITALTLAIYAKANLVTFNGPVFSTFCQLELPAYTEDCFDAILLEGTAPFVVKPSQRWAEDPWYLKESFGPRTWQQNDGWFIHRAGQAQGVTLGGEISTMLLLAGTEYMPPLDGAILFLEGDETYTPAGLDRCFTHLRHLGVYDKIHGLIVGRFPSEVGFSNDDSLAMILAEATKGYHFPIISGIDFSHTDPLLTIPMGIRCRVDTLRQEIVYLEAATAS